ncbi:MAG: hypothetical protein AB8I08_36930 [Sandaracinaceae bacterium]
MSGKKAWLGWALMAVVGIGGFGVWQSSRRADEEARDEARQTRRIAREARAEQHWAAVQEESASLMPALLEGVRLGLSRQALESARPGASMVAGQDTGEEGLTMLEERFGNGARAAYLLDDEHDRLQRVQVMSMLPATSHIGAHLTAMNEQYGTPTGVWDCPDTGGVPTRRFTWRHGRTTIADIFLVYDGRVSVTLYIAPTGVIGASLQRARCQPVPREQLNAFPVTQPAQLQEGVQ